MNENSDTCTPKFYAIPEEKRLIPLKTCPCCGSECVVYERIECYGGNSISPHVQCSNHDCELAVFGDTVQDALSKWNRRVNEMTEYKAIVKMKISEVQFHASNNLTQEELESEVFKAMFNIVYERLGVDESVASLEDLMSHLYEIQIERVKE